MPTSFALRATTKSWRTANRAGAISCGASHLRVKSASTLTHSPTHPLLTHQLLYGGLRGMVRAAVSTSCPRRRAKTRMPACGETRIYTKREGVRRSATDIHISRTESNKSGAREEGEWGVTGKSTAPRPFCSVAERRNPLLLHRGSWSRVSAKHIYDNIYAMRRCHQFACSFLKWCARRTEHERASVSEAPSAKVCG